MHMHFFFLNVIFKLAGDGEGVENTIGRQTNQRGSKDRSQLRKRKGLFNSEWCLCAKSLCITMPRTQARTPPRTPPRTHARTHWKCCWVYLLRKADISQNLSPLEHMSVQEPRPAYLLFALQKLHRFIRWFVPPGCHRVEPAGGSGCGSSLA